MDQEKELKDGTCRRAKDITNSVAERHDLCYNLIATQFVYSVLQGSILAKGAFPRSHTL